MEKNWGDTPSATLTKLLCISDNTGLSSYVSALNFTAK